MPFGIGIWELLIILVVLLLLFGAKRLPEMGRSLGKGMREFKDGVSGMTEEPPAPAALPPADSNEGAPASPESERESVTSS